MFHDTLMPGSQTPQQKRRLSRQHHRAEERGQAHGQAGEGAHGGADLEAAGGADAVGGGAQAKPRTTGSWMRMASKSGRTQTAPKMPVLTTNTGVSEGKPPMRSAMPMATGVVTDLGASESSVARVMPYSRYLANALRT